MTFLKRVVPVMVAISATALCFQGLQVIKTAHASALERQGKAEIQRRNLVVTSPVRHATVNDRLSAIGTGRAASTVSVTSWSSGTVAQLYVTAGDKVKIGDSIARLDSDNEEIALERARVELDEASQAFDRISKLRVTKTASEVQEITARIALSKAKLAVDDATLALERRTVRAPIDGIVGILPIDAGNYVTNGTTIARIDDRSKILVDIWVPERFTPLVKIGQKIRAASVARKGEVFTGKVSAIDNMIDEISRTLRVRAEIPNEDDLLRAGQSFEVTLLFPGDIFPTVDPLAIQWNGEGAYVWRVISQQVDGGEDTIGTVERVPVSIVQRNSRSILVSGPLKVDETVVIQGVQNIRQGDSVLVRAADAVDREPVTASDIEAGAAQN